MGSENSVLFNIYEDADIFVRGEYEPEVDKTILMLHLDIKKPWTKALYGKCRGTLENIRQYLKQNTEIKALCAAYPDDPKWEHFVESFGFKYHAPCGELVVYKLGV